jgi:beta-galactosidase
MSKRLSQPVTSKVSRHSLQLNGKDTFLYSGEVHYFRIPKRYWEKHLIALSEAGCNAVSTYVPWSWHEFKEGTFDVTGRTHPERDIVGFIALARKHNLYVTVKPGPYVMAETTDQGIPLWLTETYPETLARNELGQPWGSAFVAITNPIFRDRAAKWLKYFAQRAVVPNQAHKQGAVIMMQLCNEIGIFQWLGAQGDQSKSTIASWQEYLRREFPVLQDLAVLLDRELKDYSEVLPPHENCETRRQFVLYRLWHDYHRWLYADYVKFISTTLREAGVKVPFFTNIGGWVYGRAHEFALNGTFHRETAKVQPDVVFGLDHIPEIVSPNNMHDGFVANQVARELQGHKGPLYSAELQCGSREHGVQPYPDELGLFYRHCIIHGLTGMNFYMFAQGKNPKGRGTDGPMFYWYNAVDYKANRQPSYPMIQTLGSWLKQNGDMIVNARRPASLGVGFYPYLYETEFLVPILGKGTKLNAAKLGLSTDPVAFRDRAYFDGVMRILMKKSIPFDLADLTKRSLSELKAYQRLVVLSNEMMDAETQKRLADFVKGGGELVLFPTIPVYDLNFAPCQILADALGIKMQGKGTSNRIYMGQLKDIPVPSLPTLISDRGAKAIARDVNGKVVGIEKKVGKGSVRFFGFFVQYTIEEHPDLWNAMMKFDDLERNVVADNDNLNLEARFADGEGILFVGNFHRMPMASRVSVKNPRGGAPIDLGLIELPSLNGLMLPIQSSLGKGVTLVYAMGELMAKEANARGVKMVLRGLKALKGHFELKSDQPIRFIKIDGTPIAFDRNGKTVSATYEQNGLDQTIEVLI